MSKVKEGKASWLSTLKKSFSSAKIRVDGPHKRIKRRWIRLFSSFTQSKLVATKTITCPAKPVGQPSHLLRHYAAVSIQTSFRGFLARTALKALKGVVKLQALARGHIVRKRTKSTLRCMEAIIRLQSIACEERCKWRGFNHDDVSDPAQAEAKTVEVDTCSVWTVKCNMQQAAEHRSPVGSPCVASRRSLVGEPTKAVPRYMAATHSALARKPTQNVRKRLSF